MSIRAPQKVRDGGLPAYKLVRAHILDHIERLNIEVGGRLPTEIEIADHCGVSRMTANRAILSLVADGTLTRVKGRGTFLAKPLQPIARCLVAVMPDNLAAAAEDYYFGTLYWGVHQTLASRGVATEIVHFNAQLPSDAHLVAINPLPHAIDVLKAHQAGGGTVVLLGSRHEGMNWVDSDNFLGAALAVNHLVDLGHRRIAFLGACESDTNSQDRLIGFRRGMKARGLSLEPTEFWMSEAISWENEVGEALLQSVHAGVTAVFVAGPHLAVHLLRFCEDKSVRVPDELSIVAYDDPTFFQFAQPGVTTIRQPLAEMAIAACDVLVEPGTEAPRQHVLDPQLILRESTAAPRRSRTAFEIQ